MSFKRPDQFIKVIGKSTEEISVQVAQKIVQIENEMNEIGSLLIVNKEAATNSTPNSRTSVGTTNTKKALKTAQAKSLIESNPKLAELRVHYSDALYDAIKTSILNSLNNLAKSCGYQLDFHKYAESFFRNSSPSAENLSNDTEEIEIASRSGVTTEPNSRLNNDESSDLLANQDSGLKYVRLKSVDDLKYKSYDLNAKRIRPISVESVISKATWSAERKLENAFLM